MKIKCKKLLFIQGVLLLIGVFFAAKPVYHFLKREVLRIQAESRWANAIETSKEGKEHSWLSVPSADIDMLVLNSEQKEDLYDFPICREIGNKLNVIMAHRDIHFRDLGKAVTGNQVNLQLRDSQHNSYKIVDSEIINPDEVEERLKSKSDEEWLVLMTCYPFQYIGPAPKRYLVWCKSSKADIATTFQPAAGFALPSSHGFSVRLEKLTQTHKTQFLAVNHQKPGNSINR